MRVFFALELGSDSRKEIRHIQSRLKKIFLHEKVSWIMSDRFHITLRFLGDCSDSEVEILKQFFEQEVFIDFPECRFDQFGFFGSSRRSVLWLGVEPKNSFLSVHILLEDYLSKCGFSSDDRAYFPHLTLARFRRKICLKSCHDIDSIPLETMKPWRPVAVTLFASVFENGVLIYQPVARMKLDS